MIGFLAQQALGGRRSAIYFVSAVNNHCLTGGIQLEVTNGGNHNDLPGVKALLFKFVTILVIRFSLAVVTRTKNILVYF